MSNLLVGVKIIGASRLVLAFTDVFALSCPGHQDCATHLYRIHPVPKVDYAVCLDLLFKSPKRSAYPNSR